MEKNGWTEKLATGNSEIDRQHKEFINMCSGAAELAEKGSGAETLREALDKLSKYAWVHFEYEGTLIDEAGYPEAEGHKRLHSFFLDEIKAVFRKAEAGSTGESFAEEMMERLSDWFILHIEKNDIKLFLYIKTQK
jgi:hemerythrin-like metal-binding protein